MYLSIITVNKNSGNKFEKTAKNILSILDSFKKVEWIILDADSKDISAKKIAHIKKKFFKRNIKIIVEKDKGIYHAMNKGIDISKSKFIIYINSGDTININILYKFFLLRPKKNHSYVFGYKIEEKENLIILFFKKIIKKFEIFFNLSLPSSHNSIIYDLKTLRDNKFNYLYKCGSDFDQYHNLLKNKHTFSFHKRLKLTNISNKGFISKNREISYKNYLDILNKNSYKFGYFYWYLRLRLLRLK